MSKRLGGIIDCKYKTFFHGIKTGSPVVVRLGQQYNTGEKPTVMLCVCVFSSHSFWTSSSLDVPAGVRQEEGHTGFLIHFLSAVRTSVFLAR